MVEGIGNLDGVQKIIVDASETILAGMFILGDKIVVLEGLEDPLDRGRAETQMGAKLPYTPGSPLGVKSQEHRDRFFN